MSEVSEVLYQWARGVSQRKIHGSLGISRNTIKSMVSEAQKRGLCVGELNANKVEEISEQIDKFRKNESKSTRVVDLKLKPHHGQIAEWLVMPYMTVKQIWRLLSEKTPTVSVGLNSLHRYIHEYFPAKPTISMMLPTVPGSQAQVDFGYVGLMKDANDGKHRKTYAFIMTLSHSRHRFVYFVFHQNTATWIDCHQRAFQFFGGVPRTILLDNLKAGVIKPDIYDPIINKAYAECERYYGFVADPAKVRTPEHKGKVERSVTIVKQQVIAGRNFAHINEANTHARNWAVNEIAARVTRTTGETPQERFLRDEKATLLPLPLSCFECPIWSEVKVGRDQHACFLGSFYSLPAVYVEQTLFVRATPTLVQFYEGTRCVKTHCRAKNKGEWVTSKEDLHAGAQYFLNNTPQSCLAEAALHGEETYKFISILLENPSTTRLRKARAIFHLASLYGSERLNAACYRALFFGNTEYKTLGNILQKNLDLQALNDKPPLSLAILSEGAFLRNDNEFSIH
jgi:hypothetical protein